MAFYLVSRMTEEGYEKTVEDKKQKYLNGINERKEFCPFVLVSVMKVVGEGFDNPTDIRDFYRANWSRFGGCDKEWISKMTGDAFHCITPNGMYEMFFMDTQTFDQTIEKQKPLQSRFASLFKKPNYADLVAEVTI